MEIESYILSLIDRFGNASLPDKLFENNSIEEIEKALSEKLGFKVTIEKREVYENRADFGKTDGRTSKKSFLYVANK